MLAPTTSAATIPAIPSTPARIAERPGTARVPRPRSSAIREPITAGTGIRHRVTADSDARAALGRGAGGWDPRPHGACRHHAGDDGDEHREQEEHDEAESEHGAVDRRIRARARSNVRHRWASSGTRRSRGRTAPTEPPTTAGSIGSATASARSEWPWPSACSTGCVGTGRPGPPGHQHDQGREALRARRCIGEEHEPEAEDRRASRRPRRVSKPPVSNVAVRGRARCDGRPRELPCVGAGRDAGARSSPTYASTWSW